MRPSAKELKVPSAASFRPCAPAQALTRRSMSAKRRSLPASALNAFALKMALELPMLTSQATPALRSYVLLEAPRNILSMIRKATKAPTGLSAGNAHGKNGKLSLSRALPESWQCQVSTSRGWQSIPWMLNLRIGTRACRIRSIQPLCRRNLSSFLETVLSRSALPPLPIDLTGMPAAGLYAPTVC
jgi:hypothetical protein